MRAARPASSNDRPAATTAAMRIGRLATAVTEPGLVRPCTRRLPDEKWRSLPQLVCV